MAREKIRWDQSFALGVAEIDDQHRQLVNLVNRLIDINQGPRHKQATVGALEDMIDYLDAHFSAEEQLMIDRDYPGLEDHRREHQIYVHQTEAFVTAFKDGEKNLSDDILEFLQKWLVEHILDADRRLGDFIKGRGAHKV